MPDKTYQWAVAYASRGVPVIPLQREGKTPAISNWRTEASTDSQRLAQWFDNDQGYNVGIVTGYPGLNIVDVDVKADSNGWDAYNRLKSLGMLHGHVYMASTRNGGLHVGFRAEPNDGVTNKSWRARGIDVRGFGGYCVAPPSYVPGGFGSGHYTLIEMADDFSAGQRMLFKPICSRLDPAPASGMAARWRTHGGGSSGLVRVVLESPDSDGGRHRAFFWALQRAKDDGLDFAPICDAATQVGLDETYISRTVRQVSA